VAEQVCEVVGGTFAGGTMILEQCFLLDTSSMMHRAYHATKERPAYNKAGERTEAVSTFRTMVEKLQRTYLPDYTIAALDVHVPTFRKILYPEYKAQREQPDAEFLQQVPGMLAVLKEYRIPAIEVPGFEADDVIGTLCERVTKDGTSVVIVSGDKDIAQLVRPGVQFLHTGLNKMLDTEGVREVYGVAPNQIVDLLALRGDTSDNVPGARGIGDSGSLELITKYGCVEMVLKRCHEIKHARQRRAIAASVEQIKLSHTLVTIRRNVPLP
jgi:DNA polymerase I